LGKGHLSLLKENLLIKDRFYHNQFFPIKKEISNSSDLIGVLGKYALHVFDQKSRMWLSP